MRLHVTLSSFSFVYSGGTSSSWTCRVVTSDTSGILGVFHSEYGVRFKCISFLDQLFDTLGVRAGSVGQLLCVTRLSGGIWTHLIIFFTSLGIVHRIPPERFLGLIRRKAIVAMHRHYSSAFEIPRETFQLFG